MTKSNLMHLKSIVLTGISCVLCNIYILGQGPTRLNASIRIKVIDSTCSALLRNYVYPDKAVAMCNELRKKRKKRLYDTIFDFGQLANAITKDVRTVFSDNHLVIRYDPELENRIRKFVVTLQKDKMEMEQERKQNFFFRKAEILKGNIGYLVFTNFADTNNLSRKTVQAAMQFVANADALILDLRNNFGGRPEMAQEIASYFFSQPQLIGKTFNRINNSWTEEWVSNQPEITGGLVLSMPLYILTSGQTFSAAEGLTYTLRYLKNAVVVGDTTRGGAHITRSFALGNGFVGFIPFTRGENVVTKTDWDGIGIVPNVAINDDSGLLKAQELILKHQLSKSTDITEKRKLQWLLNDLQTQMINVVVPEEIVKQYTGTFDEFLFTLEHGKLYCRNTHQPDKKDLLLPISNSLFKIDELSQVEFIRANDNVISSIRLLWNDGWVDTIERSK